MNKKLQLALLSSIVALYGSINADSIGRQQDLNEKHGHHTQGMHKKHHDCDNMSAEAKITHKQKTLESLAKKIEKQNGKLNDLNNGTVNDTCSSCKPSRWGNMTRDQRIQHIETKKANLQDKHNKIRDEIQELEKTVEWNKNHSTSQEMQMNNDVMSNE